MFGRFKLKFMEFLGWYICVLLVMLGMMGDGLERKDRRKRNKWFLVRVENVIDVV